MTVPAAKDAKRLLRRLLAAKRPVRKRLLGALTEDEARAFDSDWPAWVRAGQSAPAGADWRIWVMLGGRGFGKTRAGAEWICAAARATSGRAYRLGRGESGRGARGDGRGSERAAGGGAAPRGRCCGSRAGGGWSSPSGAEAFVYSGGHAESAARARASFRLVRRAGQMAAGARRPGTICMLGLRLGERVRGRW